MIIICLLINYKSVATTQYGIRSLSYTAWYQPLESLFMPFSSFCQNIKNSVIDGYNSVIDF